MSKMRAMLSGTYYILKSQQQGECRLVGLLISEARWVCFGQQRLQTFNSTRGTEGVSQ
jgi:hypothetical protein